MKKLLFSLSAILLVGASFAQQRLVLIESFSQASCGPCAAQNPALEALLAANATKAIAIKYQVSWPGVDPMNAQNPTEIAARDDYYGITGVPDRIQDGTNMTPTQSSIDTRYAVASPVNMAISHTINPGFTTCDITVTLTAPAVWNPSNTVLQLAMIEKEISFTSPPGSNGETVFHNVMRKMVPNTSGTPVVASNFAAAGGSQTFTFTNVAIPSYIYKLTEVAFVAFVQDNTTDEIYQAGISQPAPLVDYAVVNGLAVAEEYSCDNTITGVTGVISNDGSTAITSATINYSLNGGAVQTMPYAGNLAPGATYNFSIPTLNVTTSGNQEVESYLTGINGSSSTLPIGAESVTFTRITGNGATGQFAQNFSNAAFPYADYYITSPSDQNWNRATANGGSIRYNTYVYPAGANGEVYLAPVDLSSNSNKTMSFDVAYAQYTTENDKLEVLVSTDCGDTWTNVFTKQGSALSTVPAQTASFTPASAAQWRNESINLAPYGSSNKLIVKFKATSAYGNNMYVDNINIGGNLAVIEQDLLNANVYPNPTTGLLNVTFEATGSYEVSITDLTGRVVANTANASSGVQSVEFDTTKFSEGSYVVTIISNGVRTTKNVVVQ